LDSTCVAAQHSTTQHSMLHSTSPPSAGHSETHNRYTRKQGS
jgi:hypothetical protein